MMQWLEARPYLWLIGWATAAIVVGLVVVLFEYDDKARPR